MMPDSESLSSSSGFLSITHLPSHALQHLFEFQTHHDRVLLAITCTILRGEIETFYHTALDRHLNHHRVDDTFQERLRDMSVITTTRRKPVPLPFRYLFWRAQSIYLYKLTAMEMESKTDVTSRSFLVDMAISPSGDRLAAAMDDGVVIVWDMWSHHFLRTFEHILFEDVPNLHNIFYVDNNLIVTSSLGSICVWDEDGRLRHQHISERKDLISWAVLDQEILFSTSLGDGDIHTLNPVSGSVLVILQRQEDTTEILVVDNRWLVVLDELTGIIVLDSSDFSRKDYFTVSGRYQSITHSPDCPGLVFAYGCDSFGHLKLHMFDFENGVLTLRSIFPIVSDQRGIQPVYQSLTFVLANMRVYVYDLDSGMIIRSIKIPGRFMDSCLVSMKRGELIVGIPPWQPEEKCTVEILTYSLTSLSEKSNIRLT